MGQICPFDKSLAGPQTLRIDSSGPWYRVVNLTRFPIFGSSGDRGGGPGVRDAAAAHGIRSFVRHASRSNVKRIDLTPLPLPKQPPPMPHPTEDPEELERRRIRGLDWIAELRRDLA